MHCQTPSPPPPNPPSTPPSPTPGTDDQAKAKKRKLAGIKHHVKRFNPRNYLDIQANMFKKKERDEIVAD